MKKTFVVLAVLFAAGSVLAEWLYNPSTRLLTEVVEEGVTPWVIQAGSASSGQNIYLASNGCVKSGPSDKRRLDLDTPIRDTNGMDYFIVGAGDYALSTTLVGEFVFPSNLTAVPTYFFRSCTSMTNCIFRSNLESIGDNAFRSLTALKTVVIGDGGSCSVTNIGLNAFYGCSALVGITPFANLRYIGNSAFSSCAKLEEFAVTGDISCNIPYQCFYYCTVLTNFTCGGIFSGSIGESAFQNCSALSAVRLGAGEANRVTSIGLNAFRSCSALESLTPATFAALTTLSGNAFNGASKLAQDIVVTSKNFSFGGAAFYSSAITGFFVDGTFSGSIPANTFYGCASLAAVKFGGTADSEVESIGNYSFYSCSALRTIWMPNRPASLNPSGSNAFGSIAGTAPLKNSYSAGFYADPGDPEWQAEIMPLTDDEKTRWEAIPTETKAAYKWPTDTMPVGKFNHLGYTQWVFKQKFPGHGFCIFVR